MHTQVSRGAAIAVALFIGGCLATPDSAVAATTDPLKATYVYPGVRDDNIGIATAVHCTSFSTVAERFQVRARRFDGATVGTTITRAINPNETRTLVTNTQSVFRSDGALNTPPLDQGSILVSATTTQIVCNAEVFASGSGNFNPEGRGLQAIRFNPVAATQESSPRATTDPVKTLYFFPGALDATSSPLSSATLVHCTSFSTVAETLYYVVRDAIGTVKANKMWTVAAGHTWTVATHDTGTYLEDGLLNITSLQQGVVIVKGTSNKFICRAEVLQGNGHAPGSGWDLHGLRFLPVANTLQ